MSNNIYSSINSNTTRIFAQGVEISNNTWATRQNNNDLIIGPSGAGKTRGYVKPNILQCSESLVVADTKGDLMEQVGPVLESKGYRVCRLDLVDIDKSTVGFNPLDCIGRKKDGRYNDQDMASIAEVLVPAHEMSKKDPFWDNAAKLYIKCVISYVMERLPPEERNLCTAARLLTEAGTGKMYALLEEHSQAFPDSACTRFYKLFKANRGAERMEASIVGIACEKFSCFMSKSMEKLFTRKDRFDFGALGREKTALFLCVSDTDRSMDRVVSLFYTQALNELCRCARGYPGDCLPVPVRFILDDFATNADVPNFQEITSVIRSRGISVSVILQSLTQLESIYGHCDALTIANNCDHWLYLGGQDLYTASLIARKADKREQSILGMPPGEVYVLGRGEKAKLAKGYRIEDHPNYHLTPESCAKRGRGQGEPVPLAGVEGSEPLLAEGQKEI